jgi:hypothetical protein
VKFAADLRLGVGGSVRLALAGMVLVALSLPAVALGQERAPTLRELRGASGFFPDRMYMLQLPSPRKLESGDVTVTENGAPIAGDVRVDAVGIRTVQVGLPLRSRRHLVTYRSLLPPDQHVEVTARVGGVRTARASYTTPHIDFREPATFDESDDVFPWLLALTLFAAIAALALHVYARMR